MKKQAKTKTTDPLDWVDTLDVGLVSGSAPEGAVTVAEFAKRKKCTYDTARIKLQALVDAGKLETGKFPGIQNRPTTFFWPV